MLQWARQVAVAYEPALHPFTHRPTVGKQPFTRMGPAPPPRSLPHVSPGRHCMDSSPATKAAHTTIRRRRARLIPPSFTLAVWRLRQMWRLLLVAALGNIAAVLLVCIVPLFTQVALSAGLRGVLAGQGNGAQIIINPYGTEPTQEAAIAIQQQLDRIIASDMGPYVQPGTSQFSVSLPDVLLVQDTSSGSGSGSGSGTDSGKGAVGPTSGQMQVVGADITRVAGRYTIIAGRLPAVESTDLEIALSQSDAVALKTQVGSVLHGQLPGPQPVALDLHVVGIFTPPTTPGRFASQQFQGGVGSDVISCSGSGDCYGPNFFSALASNQTIFALVANSAAIGQSLQGGPPPGLVWAYQLDLSRISTSSLDDLLDRFGKVQVDVPGQLNGSHGSQQILLNPSAYRALGTYRIQILVLQIPLLLLLLQVIALVLLFVRMMAEMLVDRQADAVAILRSRGATRRQIFNSFTLHNIGLSLLALIVGPLAAIPLVRALSLRALPPASQGAVDAISGNPLAIAYGLRWYVLAAVVTSGFAMIFSMNRAASNNILTLRRENARVTTKPFWQRLNLDLIFGGLSLIGYVSYSFAVRQVEPLIQLILSPLSLIAALLMLVAAALLFLRLLPILLALGSRLATRGRGASTMLALTQMARAPKQPIRMTLLLALATGFTLVTLVYNASQAQRLLDIAAFQTGADFTGAIPASVAAQPTFADLSARYRQIPGVTSASLGYTTGIDPRTVSAGISLQIFAVDANTYSPSALWTEKDINA